MAENMRANDDTYKALAASLLLHLLLFLIAAVFGLFSATASSGKTQPIDVVLYDAGGTAGSTAGDSASAAAPVVTVDDIVVQDKNVVHEEVQEREVKPQTNPVRTVQSASRAVQPASAGNNADQGRSSSGSGSVETDSSAAGEGSATGESSGDGTAGGGTAPAPPQERVEASLRSEAIPDYPQELIDDDVEGVVTIEILVAADGSVEAVSVESSSGYRAMDRAAVAAGWRFQFNPGDNGRRGVWTKTFRFQLN